MAPPRTWHADITRNKFIEFLIPHLHGQPGQRDVNVTRSMYYVKEPGAAVCWRAPGKRDGGTGDGA